jgi:hypothetical protein
MRPDSTRCNHEQQGSSRRAVQPPSIAIREGPLDRQLQSCSPHTLHWRHLWQITASESSSDRRNMEKSNVLAHWVAHDDRGKRALGIEDPHRQVSAESHAAGQSVRGACRDFADSSLRTHYHSAHRTKGSLTSCIVAHIVLVT